MMWMREKTTVYTPCIADNGKLQNRQESLVQIYRERETREQAIRSFLSFLLEVVGLVVVAA